MKAGIIGLGLMGGSMVQVLKNRMQAEVVALSRSEGPVKKALEDGMIDGYTTQIDETFSGCDIIFLSTPVSMIPSYVKALIPFVKKDTIITDMGSTKKNICDAIAPYKNDITFIGAHPMTGSERIGYTASKEHLFENSYYIMTPYKDADPAKIDYLRQIIETAGGIPIIMEPEKHDHVLAAISHMPHVIASGLVNTVKELDDEHKYMYRLAAGGFRDITRIASSSPEMWENICMDNKKELLLVMKSFIHTMEAFTQALEKNEASDITAYFTGSKLFRDSFKQREVNGQNKNADIYLDVRDRPGEIAQIATALSCAGINIKNIGIINSREYEGGAMQVTLGSASDRDESVKILSELNFNVVKKE